jgi:hypothetical protein
VLYAAAENQLDERLIDIWRQDADEFFPGDQGVRWTTPQQIETPGDRGFYTAPAISPDGSTVYVGYNAFHHAVPDQYEQPTRPGGRSQAGNGEFWCDGVVVDPQPRAPPATPAAPAPTPRSPSSWVTMCTQPPPTPSASRCGKTPAMPRTALRSTPTAGTCSRGSRRIRYQIRPPLARLTQRSATPISTRSRARPDTWRPRQRAAAGRRSAALCLPVGRCASAQRPRAA